jgi:hypothetical protein
MDHFSFIIASNPIHVVMLGQVAGDRAYFAGSNGC